MVDCENAGDCHAVAAAGCLLIPCPRLGAPHDDAWPLRLYYKAKLNVTGDGCYHGRLGIAIDTETQTNLGGERQ